MLLLFVTVWILITMPGCAGLWAVKNLQAEVGGSITIPCYYNWRFRENEKFWCRGRVWYTCKQVRESEGHASMTDDRGELVTTLTLTGLQVKDAGRYWCAVKIKGLMKNDLRVSVELQVEKVPDLRIRTPALFVPEGGSVSVQCSYSDKLKGAEKSWCRGGAMQSCQSERNTMQLKDDGRGLFTVTIVDFQRGDAGWYWCSTAGVQAPVHINVTAAPHNTTHNYTVFPKPTLVSSTSSPSTLSSSPTLHTSTVALTPTSTAALTHTHSTNTTPSSTANPSSSPGPELKDRPAPAPATSRRLRAFGISVLTAVIILTMATMCWRRRVHHQHREVQVNDGWTDSLDLSMSEEDDGEETDGGETLDGEWTEAAVLQLHDEENV